MSKTKDSENPIEISVEYIDNDAFEETRLEMYSIYNSNNQNHSSYIITVIISAVAFLAGIIALLETSILYFSILISFGLLLLLLYFWLGIRAKYWSISADQSVILTKEEIVDLFNNYNKIKKGYTSWKPPYTAIIQSALIMKLAEIYIYHEKVKKERISRLALLTNDAVDGLIKKIKAERQSKKCHV